MSMFNAGSCVGFFLKSGISIVVRKFLFMLHLSAGRMDALFRLLLTDLLAGRRKWFTDRIEDREVLLFSPLGAHRRGVYQKSRFQCNSIDYGAYSIPIFRLELVLCCEPL